MMGEFGYLINSKAAVCFFEDWTLGTTTWRCSLLLFKLIEFAPFGAEYLQSRISDTLTSLPQWCLSARVLGDPLTSASRHPDACQVHNMLYCSGTHACAICAKVAAITYMISIGKQPKSLHCLGLVTI